MTAIKDQQTVEIVYESYWCVYHLFNTNSEITPFIYGIEWNDTIAEVKIKFVLII